MKLKIRHIRNTLTHGMATKQRTKQVIQYSIVAALMLAPAFRGANRYPPIVLFLCLLASSQQHLVSGVSRSKTYHSAQQEQSDSPAISTAGLGPQSEHTKN